ncbi:LPD1 domain-containing protein [Psychrobacter sp. W2-37-MNA-CIBAN-0211]|uniref:LPD1 domain-containing protein n=1 Tax=Psychrobacter sp. W2-37-MNA-CIBAN-0211 TaxID=3140443 RepID=UPI0033346BE2
MTTKSKIAELTALQQALTELQAATNPIKRVVAGKALMDALESMGLYSQNDNEATLAGAETTEGADNEDDEYSDNPNDDNYRYADTGYIAGSQKEKASQRIKSLAKDGFTVKVTDIEWDEIESDSLLAEDMIKKANIIGDVDYQSMKDGGGDAGTAFLIQKVLASVAPTPHWDITYFIKNSNVGKRFVRGNRYSSFVRIDDALLDHSIEDQKRLARRAYVIGINSLKARIIDINTPLALVDELRAIADEMGGFTVSAGASEDYLANIKDIEDLKSYVESKSKDYENAYKDAAVAAEQGFDMPEPNPSFGTPVVKWENGKFTVYHGRGSMNVIENSRYEWLKDNYAGTTFSSSTRGIAHVVEKDDEESYRKLAAVGRNEWLKASIESLMKVTPSLSWLSLGERFWAVIELTSTSFVKHANKANRKEYDDWDLTVKPAADDDGESATPTKKKTTFELVVADKIERIGGDPITVKSTQDLKEQFGFREIQLGNWVLKDKASAKFHVENAAAAMMDLSDVVGIDMNALAFDGRLALSLAARGRSKAMAHYEPSERIINITKMKGGGSLGHEWFHAIDNILGEVLNIDGATGANVMLTVDPSILGDSPLGSAFSSLQDAMMLGVTRSPETFKIKDKDIRLAVLNISETSRLTTAKKIYDAGSADKAVIAVDETFASKYRSKRSKNHRDWRKVAVAYYHQDKADESVVLSTGELVSEFYANSKKLDEGRSKPYWSSTHEMAARSFQAFLEDSLKDKERRNDYLSFGADNDLYGGNHQAYPEGVERKVINIAFKKLFEVIKSEKVFENAAKNKPMMDAIFGVERLFIDADDYE